MMIVFECFVIALAACFLTFWCWYNVTAWLFCSIINRLFKYILFLNELLFYIYIITHEHDDRMI